MKNSFCINPFGIGLFIVFLFGLYPIVLFYSPTYEIKSVLFSIIAFALFIFLFSLTIKLSIYTRVYVSTSGLQWKNWGKTILVRNWKEIESISLVKINRANYLFFSVSNSQGDRIPSIILNIGAEKRTCEILLDNCTNQILESQIREIYDDLYKHHHINRKKNQ